MFLPLIRTVSATAALAFLASCGNDAATVASSTNPATGIRDISAADADAETPAVAIPVPTGRVAGNPNSTNRLSPSEGGLRACTAENPRSTGKPASFQKTLMSASGKIISFQVFEPKNFDCKKGSPLILQGHGFGGSRQTTNDGLVGRLTAAGYGVISIDQRGFGDSTGTVRVLDPEFEGKDLLQILDWAEANLDWLSYDPRPDLETSTGEKFNLVAGSIGGSYGGGYQLLIHNIDRKRRLDALAPDIAWNDLRYSLNPGNVVKTGWDLLLVAGGESGGIQPKLQAGNIQEGLMGGLDPVIRETLIRGATSNAFPAGALNFFRYHSPDYFCNPDDKAQPIAFGLDPLVGAQTMNTFAQTKPNKVDILFTQGIRDTLFNFNEAWRNVQCYRALGGDVRLMTHESGHILPVSATAAGAAPGVGMLLAEGAKRGLNVPKFQEAAGPQSCAGHSVQDATFDFFEEKLQGKSPEQRLSRYRNQVCMSLNADATEAVLVPVKQFLAPARRDTALNAAVPMLPVTPASTPIPQGVAAVAAALINPTVLPVELTPELKAAKAAGKLVLAGIPVAQLNIASAAPASNPACTEIDGATVNSPVGVGGVGLSCDPIVFVGVGLNTAGAGWRLVDDQIVPVRGFATDKPRVVELNGIAEKVGKDDSIALLVFGFHPQFPASFSRDVLLPAVTVSGKVQLPLLTDPTFIKAPAGN